MKKRTVVTVVLALVMALAATFVFTGCGNKNDGDNHPADTSFEGAISEQSYDSIDEAAGAFIENEICGKTTQATFVSYTKEKDLTEDEIAALNLGEGHSAEDVTSAESGNATYTEVSAHAAESDATGAKNVRLYIIRIGDYYFYYVPIFKKGELITKSYISEILDYSKYINMTETSVAKSTVKQGNQIGTSTVTTTTKVTENVVYSCMSTVVNNTTQTTEYYFIASGGRLVAYVSYNSGEWSKLGTSSYKTVTDYLETAFSFDHTYFERTDSGFKMTSEKLIAYMNDVMPTLNQMGGTITGGNANYYVQEGKLDSVDIALNLNVAVQGTTATATVNVHTTYTDYGTTVITIPAEVDALL